MTETKTVPLPEAALDLLVGDYAQYQALRAMATDGFDEAVDLGQLTQALTDDRRAMAAWAYFDADARGVASALGVHHWDVIATARRHARAPR